MTEVDVARAVEDAPLHDMRTMGIGDVYTLTDVQLRQRPTPRELYVRWERQNRSADDIDFTQDVAD